MTDPLDFLLPQPAPQGPSYVFGTVTSVDPIEVKLDGDESARPVTTTMAMVRVDDRVWVTFAGKSTIIAGIVDARNVRETVLSNAIYAHVDGHATAEPSWRLFRDFGGTVIGSRLYIVNSTTEPRVALGVYVDGTSMAQIRVNPSGEVKIVTSASSPAGAATRPLPFATAGGRVNVSLTAASSGSAAVSFPASRFTEAPLVFLTQSNLPASSNKLVPKATSVSTSGFSAYAYTGDGTSVSVTAQFDWVAIQMTEAAAAG